MSRNSHLDDSGVEEQCYPPHSVLDLIYHDDMLNDWYLVDDCIFAFEMTSLLVKTRRSFVAMKTRTMMTRTRSQRRTFSACFVG